MDLSQIAEVSDQKARTEQYRHACEQAISESSEQKCQQLVDHCALSLAAAELHACDDAQVQPCNVCVAYALNASQCVIAAQGSGFAGSYGILMCDPVPCRVRAIAWLNAANHATDCRAVLASEVPLVISRPVLLQFVNSLDKLKPEVQQPIAS